jgi:ABC-type transport system involved in multi-copper enzyme maturation permease subunit
MIAPTTPTGPTGGAPSLAPTSVAEPAAPTPGGSWLAEFARLVRWELFLAWRRRAMMITLGSLLLVGYFVVVLFQYGLYISVGADGQTTGGLVENLTFPGAVSIGGGYVSYVGVLLFVVLAGALIGSEYSYSTLRLSLARGVGRGRLLAAQVVALALMALGLTALMLTLSGLVGLLGTATGLSQTHTIISAALVGELIAYWLALALNIFAYALIALWIGTLSRSVAGAIAGPLVFIVVEVVAGDILMAIAAVSERDTMLNMIAHIPQYLLGVNVGALITLAGDGPYALTNGQAPVSGLHALIVCGVYCALFIGISYLALAHRDIVE